MAESEALRIEGLTELEAKLKETNAALLIAFRASLRAVGKEVSLDVRGFLSGFGPSASRKTVMGVGPRVRSGLTVTVEQGSSKTTGKRPDWGATQMRYAFLPALNADQDTVEAAVEAAVTTVLQGESVV